MDIGWHFDLKKEVRSSVSGRKRGRREREEMVELTGRGRYSEGDLIRGTEAAAAY